MNTPVKTDQNDTIVPLKEELDAIEESMEIDKAEVFKVDKVLQKRRHEETVQYFVSWMGFEETHNSWVSLSELTKSGCSELIASFEEENEQQEGELQEEGEQEENDEQTEQEALCENEEESAQENQSDSCQEGDSKRMKKEISTDEESEEEEDDSDTENDDSNDKENDEESSNSQTSREFYCKECGESFKNKNLYKVHMLSHRGGVLFSCNECSFTCGKKKHLKSHVSKAHSSEDTHKCEQCSFKCSTKGALTQHMKMHDDNIFYCDSCSFSCNNKGSLVTHKKSHENDLSSSSSEEKICTSSDEEITTNQPRRRRGRRRRLKRIKKIIDDDDKPTHQCSFCEKVLRDKYSLESHESIHTGERRLKCSKCSYQTNKRIHLERHEAKHTGVTPFPCDKCDKKFSHRYDLKAHALVHGEKKWACSECSFVTHRECNLKDHMLTHTEGHRYSCNLCDFVCKQKRSLVTHMSTHTGEYKYHCDYCEYKTSNKCVYDKHMIKHTSTTFFKCEQCPYESRDKSLLAAHMRIHAASESCKCTECDFVTKNERYLRNHMEKHFGAKNFTCTFCPFKTREKRSLEKHLKRHSEFNPYRCKFCTFGSTLAHHVRTHMLKAHPDESANCIEEYEPEEQQQIEEEETPNLEQQQQHHQIQHQHEDQQQMQHQEQQQHQQIQHQHQQQQMQLHHHQSMANGEVMGVQTNKMVVDLHKKQAEEMVPHNFVSAILNEGNLNDPSSGYIPQGENNNANNTLTVNTAQALPVTNTPDNSYVTPDKYFYSHFGSHSVNYNVQPPLSVSQNSNIPFSVPNFNTTHNMNSGVRSHDGIQHPNMPVAMNFSLHGMHHVHNVSSGTDLRFPTITPHNMDYNTGFTTMNQNIDDSNARQKLLAEIYNPGVTAVAKEEMTANRHNVNTFGVPKPKTKKIRKPMVDDGTKPFACDICGYRSKCVTNLNIHKRIHTGEKPFSCETCSKRFVSRGELIRHERVHTGEKPYTCDVCHKRFARSSTLNNHKIVHQREKRFKCQQCPFATHRKSYLEDHLKCILAHTDERPHICDICQYKTNRKTLLDVHRKKCVNRKERKPRGRKKKIKTEGSRKARPGPKPVVQKEEDFINREIDSLVNQKIESLISRKTYNCGLCSFIGSSNKELDKHMEKHSVEKHGGKLVIEFKVPLDDFDKAAEEMQVDSVSAATSSNVTCPSNSSSPTKIDKKKAKPKKPKQEVIDPNDFVKDIANQLQNLPDMQRALTEQLLKDLLSKANGNTSTA